MPASRRDQLVATALEIFCRDGFHATGIDKIIAAAGVAKMTLYNHFKSKDELILATLRRRYEDFRNWFMRRVEALARTPHQRLLVIFDVLAEWFRGSGFTGCMFINASAEYNDAEHPIHCSAAEHKRLVLNYIEAQTTALGAPDPATLAREIMLLMEGAIVLAHVANDDRAAATAKNAANKLIEDALQAVQRSTSPTIDT